MFDGPSRSMRCARRNARRLQISTAKKFRSGVFCACARRNPPLPGPISTSTGWSLPKISCHRTVGTKKVGAVSMEKECSVFVTCAMHTEESSSETTSTVHMKHCSGAVVGLGDECDQLSYFFGSACTPYQRL